MRRFTSPITRLSELRRQQVRLAEITAMTRLGELRAAQQRVEDAVVQQTKLQNEITRGLAATKSVIGHVAGITALKNGEEFLALLSEQQAAAANRLAEALGELHQAHADEQLMKQLHDRQLKQHRDDMLRREEHGLLETALALRHGTHDSTEPLERSVLTDDAVAQHVGRCACGPGEEDRSS